MNSVDAEIDGDSPSFDEQEELIYLDYNATTNVRSLSRSDFEFYSGIQKFLSFLITTTGGPRGDRHCDAVDVSILWKSVVFVLVGFASQSRR